MTYPTKPPILYLTNDLMFSSRVRAFAQPLGRQVFTSGSANSLLDRLKQTPSDLVIVDLGTCKSELAGLVQSVRDQATGSVQVIAYASHVDETTLEAASAAGFDQVLTRGQFDRGLALLLN
jgi:CheY-like chemotaxis protein